MVVDQADTPFFLGAVHRVLPGHELDQLALAARTTDAEVEWHTREAALDLLAAGTWVATDSDRWLVVRADTTGGQSALEHLHGQVLPRLGHGTSLNTSYRHDVEGALRGLHNRGVAVLMPAPDFDLVDRTIRAGRLLPEKATSFQPKPSLGVIMRAVDDS